MTNRAHPRCPGRAHGLAPFPTRKTRPDALPSALGAAASLGDKETSRGLPPWGRAFHSGAWGWVEAQ